VLEFFRSGNWTFFGVPTAQIVTVGFILFGIAIIAYRHGPGRPAEADPDEDGATGDDVVDDADEADPDATRPGAIHEPDAPPV
jgi:hypothetical protein